MKHKLVIVADLGCFRAYRLEENHDTQRPHSHLELIEEVTSELAHSKFRDRMADGQGRFPRGEGAGHHPGDMSSGERHNLKTEEEKRLIQHTGSMMQKLLDSKEFDNCYFAAASQVNQRILDELSAGCRTKIAKNVAKDLTKVEESRLLQWF